MHTRAAARAVWTAAVEAVHRREQLLPVPIRFRRALHVGVGAERK
jgi:hypothetical protein